MVRKFLVLTLILPLAFMAGSVKSDAPSGIITIQVKSLNAVDNMGVSWVDGILTFQGKPHAFKIKGLKPSIAGVRNFYAQGEVYNLKTASDLAGTYQKADPAGTHVVPGAKDLSIQNDKGVVINLRVIKKRLLGKMRTIGEVVKREGVPLDLMPEGLIIDQVREKSRATFTGSSERQQGRPFK